ncbi:hypothetical protein Syun_003772 [Stephania yunnanensis]|uniref:Uncharacterized protein n=1 Tax=Stephania yunnanensis TaxID=152371 RepID=A0AAP0L4E0_9MAGN
MRELQRDTAASPARRAVVAAIGSAHSGSWTRTTAVETVAVRRGCVVETTMRAGRQASRRVRTVAALHGGDR